MIRRTTTRYLGSKPVRLVDDSPGTDVQRRDVIGGSRVPTRSTAEKVSALPVPLLDMPTDRTLPTRVPRIDFDHGDTGEDCLVGNKATELKESPVRHPVSLAATGLGSATDTPEVLKSDSMSGAFRSSDDVLGDDVVCIGLEPGLLPGDLPQFSFGRLRTLALQVLTTVAIFAAILFYSSSAVALPSAVDREIDNPEIDTQELLNIDLVGLFDIAGATEIENSVDEQEVYLTLTVFEELPLVLAANKIDLHPTVQCPYGQAVVTEQSEDPIIIGLGRVLFERTAFPTEYLIRIRDFCDAANCHLCRQPELSTDLVVYKFMKVILSERLGIPSLGRYPIACLVASLQCPFESIELRGRWMEFDVCSEFHCFKYRGGVV